MAESRLRAKVSKVDERIRHVFVDFENVPNVDLNLIGEARVEVILLIGEKQRRLELGLVRQIHEHAAKVTLVEVGASGRNALDLVLAWHLGKTAERYPADPFFVISKDRDFDPLLTHLRARGLSVERIGEFAELPFLPAGKRLQKTKALSPPVQKTTIPTRAREETAPSTAAIAKPTPGADRLEKVIDRLRSKTKARPVRKKTLLAHINGFYRNALSNTELEEIVERLKAQGIVEIDPLGAVRYPTDAKSGA